VKIDQRVSMTKGKETNSRDGKRGKIQKQSTTAEVVILSRQGARNGEETQRLGGTAPGRPSERDGGGGFTERSTTWTGPEHEGKKSLRDCAER